MRKDLLTLGFIILLIVILFSGTKIQSVDEYYLTHIDEITEESETVFLTIRSDTALKHLDRIDPKIQKHIPSTGVILEETEYVLRPKDTAFDIVNRAARYNKIQMEYQGANLNIYKSVYIQGINYLYEFSCGPQSGWMYAVNGEFPNYGLSKYRLKDGDKIEVLYTCELGKDLGYKFN